MFGFIRLYTGLARRRIFFKPLIFVFYWLFLIQASYAQGLFEFKGQRNHSHLDFEFYRNLIILPVYINEQGPFHFIFDTGVSSILLTNPDLLDSLHLSQASSVMIKGFGKGKDIKAGIVNGLSLKIGPMQGTGFTAAVLPKDILDFSTYVGTQIDGIIGYDLAKDFRIRIDYDHQQIDFNASNSLMIPKGFVSIPLFLDQAHPYVDAIGVLNGKSIRFHLVIDTGAGNTVFLDQNSNTEITVPKKNIDANLGWGINGPIDGKISRLATLAIGEFQLKQVLCAFPNFKDSTNLKFSKIGSGNLGNEVLKRFLVILDYKQGRLLLRKQARFNAPFEYDMSGIGFTAEGSEFQRYIISSIDPGSPSEKAGLKIGDVLITINNLPISSYSVNDLDNLFRSGDKKRIFLEYYREGTFKETTLFLKKRV